MGREDRASSVLAGRAGITRRVVAVFTFLVAERLHLGLLRASLAIHTKAARSYVGVRPHNGRRWARGAIAPAPHTFLRRHHIFFSVVGSYSDGYPALSLFLYSSDQQQGSKVSHATTDVKLCFVVTLTNLEPRQILAILEFLKCLLLLTVAYLHFVNSAPHDTEFFRVSRNDT